jgi:hypothetical protein
MPVANAPNVSASKKYVKTTHQSHSPSITGYVEKARCRRHSAPGSSFQITSISPNALTHAQMIINRPKKTLKFVIT